MHVFVSFLVFAVGAYESDRALILRVNPVVSIETTMHVQPRRITASGPYLDLGVCFRYTGASPSLQANLGIYIDPPKHVRNALS